MSAAAPMTEHAVDGFLGQRRVVEHDNPHADRFGYMPGVFSAKVEVRKTGYAYLPQGRLIRFQTFSRGGDYNIGHIENPKQPEFRSYEVTAAEAAENAKTEFNAADEIDQGFVDIPQLIGNPQAQAYFDAVHPSFESIGHTCPFGLAICPTCRLEMLASGDYAEYLDRLVVESNLDIDILNATVNAVRSACERYSTYAAQAWNDVVQKQEIAKNQQGMVIIGRAHHHWRKSVHIMTAQEVEDNRFSRLLPTPAGARSTPTESEEIQALRAENAANQERLAALEAKFSQNTSAAPVLCSGTTGNGEQCKNNATKDGRCGKHPLGEQANEAQ